MPNPKPKLVLPELKQERADKMIEYINLYIKTYSDKYDNPHFSDTSKIKSDRMYWRDRDIDLYDIYHIGTASVRDILKHLNIGDTAHSYAKQRCVIEALSKFAGGLIMYSYDEKSHKVQVVDGDKVYDADKVPENFVHESLTRWDKFWGFFGIKTEHAKDVAAHNILVDHIKETSKMLTVAAEKNKLNDFVKNNEELYRKNIEIADKARDNMEKWNKAFFGENKAEDYRLGEKTIPALSVCMAIYSSNPAYPPLSSLDPETLGDTDKARISETVDKYNQILKDKELRKKLKNLDNFSTTSVSESSFDAEIFKKLTANTVAPINTTHDMAFNYPFIKARADLTAAVGKNNPGIAPTPNEEEMRADIKNLKRFTKLYENASKNKYGEVSAEIKDNETLDDLLKSAENSMSRLAGIAKEEIEEEVEF